MMNCWREATSAAAPVSIHHSSFIIQHSAPSRRVWDNPVVWREMRTWAYGRKILVVRLAYLALFGAAAAVLFGMFSGGQLAAHARRRWSSCRWFC